MQTGDSGDMTRLIANLIKVVCKGVEGGLPSVSPWSLSLCLLNTGHVCPSPFLISFEGPMQRKHLCLDISSVLILEAIGQVGSPQGFPLNFRE